MIMLNVKCPYCNESFMDNEHEVSGYPSVSLITDHEGKRGWTRLCSLYGDYSAEFEHEHLPGSIVKVFCPHCGKELQSTRVCEKCGAPMVHMSLEGGGLVQICSRIGCHKHLIEFENIDTDLKSFFDIYHIF
ncbi:hypothetical protein JW877_00965 [bacterium]|nr:hypothetical protein [bacterium]